MKILHVYPKLNCGGTEMVIYNLIRFGNHNANKFDLLTQSQGDNEQIFIDEGCRINRIPKTDSKSYRYALRDFFSNNRYDVVHCHMHNDMGTVLKAAKECGIEVRVAHSHNARIDIPRILWPLFHIRHHQFEKYATRLFGCSQLALKWFFPTRWKEGTVIYNGIDLDKFRFDAAIRSKVRKDNNISPSTRVCINVGRCTDQKNQRFILELAKGLRTDDFLFIIIGEGPLYDSLKQEKERHNLDNVWLMGKRTDVVDWLNASDMFLFPSIYEGLGIVAIEAQASGLPVIASDKIPDEADMHLGLFTQIPVADRDKWLSSIRETNHADKARAELSEKALEGNYNISNVTRKVEKIYSEKC